MSNAQQTLKPFLELREKNLRYFEKEYNDIFKLFREYKMSKYQLNILTESNEVNLLFDQAHVYPQGAKQYAAEEVEKFRSVFKEGSKVYSFNPPVAGDYAFPRTGQLAVNELLEKSPVTKKNFSGFTLGDFYPLIVFLGVGLGYHIEKMMSENDIHNAIIVEPELDRFAASLYSVDWEEICSKYKADKGRAMHFILGAQEDEYVLWAVIWNRLVELSPQFPVLTLFYNHEGKALFDRVSDRVNRDLMVFLLSWGHYDDEIRQLNNAIHNFHLGVKELPKGYETRTETPIIVVGAGPSLDDRIEDLKKAQDKAIIVSCGTALKTLAAYDLKPDIHVELESDLLAYIAVSQAASEEFYRDIKLVGPSHISPLIFQLFGDGRMYYKRESATAMLFGQKTGHIIHNGTPTCTNLGVALAISMGFKNIFLFGLDFGFRDVAHHHAKGSIYYEKLLKLDHETKDLVRVETVDGATAWSTPNYFSSKRKVESVLTSHELEGQLEVRNCSDVAKIDGAEWLPKESFDAVFSKISSRKAEDMAYMFNEHATTCNLDDLKHKLEYLEFNLVALSNDLKKQLAAPVSNLSQMSIACGKVNWYLEEILRKRTPDFYYTVRGSLRHYLCAGFAHALAIEDKDELRDYAKAWRKAVLDFYDKLPAHFRSVAFKQFDVESDPWMKQAITDREDGINPFFTEDIKDLQLTF